MIVEFTTVNLFICNSRKLIVHVYMVIHKILLIQEYTQHATAFCDAQV